MASNANAIGPSRDELRRELSDWSSTGRGFHVDFQKGEIVPIKHGRVLGHGANGHVYETTIKGHRLAWKQIHLRRDVVEADRKEIEILKKLSHPHIIQVIGSYTHDEGLGLLLSPVAVCDLKTFFEDVEALSRGSKMGEQQSARLSALGYHRCERLNTSIVVDSLGCLLSAIAYLHDQKIRHKDLKPGNILLMRGGLCLSDFGTATDFSLYSQSATANGERGTERYFAPEVAIDLFYSSGTAADIFSLGCVLLEILILHRDGTLDALNDPQTSRRLPFHANLDTTEKLLIDWMQSNLVSSLAYHFGWEIRNMLAKDPKRRPTAKALLKRVEEYDRWDGNASIFRDCCRAPCAATQKHMKTKLSLEQKIEKLNKGLRKAKDKLEKAEAKEQQSQTSIQTLEKKKPRFVFRIVTSQMCITSG